jgi:hypothetical protein
MRQIGCLVLVATAACGPDEYIPAGPDAPGSTACGVVAGTIAAYPGSYTGATVGAGADLAVSAGSCAVEDGHSGASGDDQVVALTNLIAGEAYVVTVDTVEDLSFYVTTACSDGGPTTGACALHVDATLDYERGAFDAPGADAFVVIDSANSPIVPTTGSYTVHVTPVECSDPADCTDPSRPVCSIFGSCVACVEPFDCDTAGAAFCTPRGTCEVGPATCVADDAAEPDDGPADARILTVPTAGNPTTITGSICAVPFTFHTLFEDRFGESDWYGFDVAAQMALRIEASWSQPSTDIDFMLWTDTGFVVVPAATIGGSPEVAVVDIPPGRYYIEVHRFAPEGTAVTPYTLSLSLPECGTHFDCASPTEPICMTGECVAGPATCTGDDAADAGDGDDGPAGATNAGAMTQMYTRAACNTPAIEADWFRVPVAAGQGITATLDFAAGLDFDIRVFDDTGALVGLSFWARPEIVELTYLPAGAYYVRVDLFEDPPVTAAVAYTLQIDKTAAQTCTTVDDCAATYSTQRFRGNCTGGVCRFIAPGSRADGMPCDSGEDCMSDRCSYVAFESDAQDSVCTPACSSAMDCMFAPGLTCTTGFPTNQCVPSCTSDLECGADVNSSSLDAGQPWDYFVCTVATGACGP